ncbi:Integrator complex subunit 11 [Galemys pyrenaicus]|uniref:Integrator complex subunit 11 n=2 Tax=Boreoeutheria TaxID=1437010 RepID=A0A8J5ZE61_GALPY|nr:Integrator complex subunit 11 [Galemys pyrenaicus]
MPEIRVTPLGAGQDVGRSCILVSIAGKNVMLDCGMHMGYNDDRRFPDFSYITRNGRLTDFLDCVIIRWRRAALAPGERLGLGRAGAPASPTPGAGGWLPHLPGCCRRPWQLTVTQERTRGLVPPGNKATDTWPWGAALPRSLGRSRPPCSIHSGTWLCRWPCDLGTLSTYTLPAPTGMTACSEQALLPPALRLCLRRAPAPAVRRRSLSPVPARRELTHFHLDHCGALPYFSEMVGYDGPIYMTHPTQAICPILLEDYRKIAVDKKGEANFFTSQMIKDCMKKVVAVHLHQTVQVDDELEIKAYYAGHVLGAAMFQIKVGSESVVYTVSGEPVGGGEVGGEAPSSSSSLQGDYNMTPDRHLGAAWIDRCRPNLLITESTYATTIRDSKRCRERDFLKKVHETVERGGKVLIPVFALGRAQELCILLETFWERMNLKAPIYFSTGLTEKANHYYKLFITWTNQKIRKTFVQRNMFEFKHIKAFDRAFADNPGPMTQQPTGRTDSGPPPQVVFATPGMLHAGQSLQIFRKWAGNERNMVKAPLPPRVIMPGYCVQGTVGHKILSGQRKLEMEGRQVLEVKMQVEYMSFSAHADAKGIMQLVGQAEPENVLLVHGEAKKMEFLRQKIEQEFRVSCYMPANGETVVLPTSPSIPVGISLGLLKREMAQGLLPDAKKPRLLHGTLVMKDGSFRLVSSEQALKELGLAEHQLRFTCRVHLRDPRKEQDTAARVCSHLRSVLKDHCVQHLPDGSVTVESILVQAATHSEDPGTKVLLVSWTYQDEELGSYLTALLKKGLPQAPS